MAAYNFIKDYLKFTTRGERRVIYVPPGVSKETNQMLARLSEGIGQRGHSQKPDVEAIARAFQTS